MLRNAIALLSTVFLVACAPESTPETVEEEPMAEHAASTSDWQQTTPAEAGLDGDAIAQLDAEIREGQHGLVDSMLIIRGGKLAFEAYYEHDYETMNADRVTGESGPWNYWDVNWHPYYDGTELHTIQSSTKSFMSAMVGIAIARGEISGTDATLAELLPHRNISDPEKAAITLEDILTMRAGFEWNEDDLSYWHPDNDSTMVEKTDDWVAYLLAKPLANEPGSTYNYSSTVTQLMSEIVSTASGMPLDEYAEKFLFGPIGIDEYMWKDAPEGFKDVAGGMYFKPRDFARFGLLYANDGMWEGNQVVPADWVKQSGAAHVERAYPEVDGFDVGYGYQFWVFAHGTDGNPYMYGTWGWGGQFALIVPELDLVGVFTGWNVYDEIDAEYAYRLFYERVVLTADSE